MWDALGKVVVMASERVEEGLVLGNACFGVDGV